MVVLAILKAQAGKEQEMEEILKNLVKDVSQEENTLTYVLHKNQNDPTTFMFYEKYTDVDALVAHSSTPYFKDVFGKLAPLLDGKPEIVTYDEIASI